MCAALGHSVGLCSRVGHGTRFSITAPFAGKARYALAQPAPANSRPYGLSGAKVAVIDNDGSVLEAMQSLLEHWSCDVTLLRDLEEVERAIAGGYAPDIMLVDYHLDRGTCGLSAVASMRAAAGDPALPAVIITADHTAATEDRTRSADCELLTKPVKPAELRALMAHLVSKHGN
jgi:CheY-like chemotaxis protein